MNAGEVVLVFLTLGFLGISLWYLRSQQSLRKEHQVVKERLQQSEHQLQLASRHLQALLAISHTFVEADSEPEIVQTLLSQAMNLSGAVGASFVPLDAYGQPSGAIRRGEFPMPVPDAWLEYLASASVRQSCAQCQVYENHTGACRLLQGPFSDLARLRQAEAGPMGIYCFPLRYGGHGAGYKELGMLNLYLPNESGLVLETHTFLRSLADVSALALEGEHLRQREFAALTQVRMTRQKSDLNLTLKSILENLCQAMDADLGLIVLEPVLAESSGYLENAVVVGEMNLFDRGSLLQILRQTWESEEEIRPMDILEISQIDEQGVRRSPAWLGVRIFSPEMALGISTAPDDSASSSTATLSVQGVLLLGSLQNAGQEVGQDSNFQKRRLAILQAAARKVALLLQDRSRMAHLEYQVMMEERTRLAREIHDGLAQTLGFLKLQGAQMLGLIERIDQSGGGNEEAAMPAAMPGFAQEPSDGNPHAHERLGSMMRLSYNALAEAYQDARRAIDALRIQPGDQNKDGIKTWLEQIVADFAENSVEYNHAGPAGLRPPEVVLGEVDVRSNLPPEVHAQLIRITQEALNNARKHAQARQVELSCVEKDQDLLLEIRDDGRGFSFDELPGIAHYGLRGMRERADLLGADFQVISQPGEGTTVRIRLPLRALLALGSRWSSDQKQCA